MNDEDEFSSFEIEESVIDTQKPNASIDSKNYRSPMKDSSESLTSESQSGSDAIVLSSDDEDKCKVETDSDSDSEAAEINNSMESADSSSDEEFEYKEVTRVVYDAHVAEIGKITDRINQNENLLKLSSQLPDKGNKLKQLVAKLNSDLEDKRNILKSFKIKEPSELELDFQNLSINENESKEVEPNELSCDDTVSVSKLFGEIKRSEKSMPNENDLADQPQLINGNLMPHQRHALAWMIWRENQYPKGGILGDDMGLGKTLTTISLIARHIEMKRSRSVENESQNEGGKWE